MRRVPGGGSLPLIAAEEKTMINEGDHNSGKCRGVTRRSFLADTGMGFTGLALGAMLFKDGAAQATILPSPRGRGAGGEGALNSGPRSVPHFIPKAKSV